MITVYDTPPVDSVNVAGLKENILEIAAGPISSQSTARWRNVTRVV